MIQVLFPSSHEQLVPPETEEAPFVSSSVGSEQGLPIAATDTRGGGEQWVASRDRLQPPVLVSAVASGDRPQPLAAMSAVREGVASGGWQLGTVRRHRRP